jgi:hypothetical protein
MKHGGISVVRITRSFIYRPLAVILAIVLLPMLCRYQGDSGIWSSEASAAALPGSKTVIQNHGIGPIASDLVQLENKAVAAYLGLHKLPDSDANIIYTYGRSDLRGAVRGLMFDILMGIIETPASERKKPEKALYEWFQRLVQQNEIEYYKLALDQFGAWERDPCLFSLDPVIASEYELSYNGAPYCGRQLSNVFLGAEIPDESYFLAYGLKNSYGKLASTNPDFGALVADTGINVGVAWGIGASIAATLALATGATVTAVAVSAALAAATAAATVSAAAGAVSAGAATGVTAVALSSSATLSVIGGSIGGALAVALAPFVIVLLAAIIGVAAGIQVFTTENTKESLKKLNASLKQVTDTPPDLSTFANESSGLGIYKLEATLVAQTVPDVPSTATLPVHSAGDLNFAIQTSTQSLPQVASTLSYQNWEGASWTTQTSGGWFVQTCTGVNCRQSDSISADIRYVDWSGVKWTATRFGDQFVSVKNKAASTDTECGLSAGPNFSQCKSFISNSIQLMAPGGVLETVALSVSPPSTPPVFANVGAIPFTPGIASNQTVTASGSPAARVCFSSVTPALPPDFTLPAGDCKIGNFQMAFNGNPNSPQQAYQLVLSASNGTTPGPVLQTFTIDVSQHLMITSPSLLSGTAGFPVNFQVATTGLPPISLSVTPSLIGAFGGLKFTDNGNGTGIISGTPQRPGNLACAIINGQPGCGVIASNAQSTVIQGFGISMAPAPAASIGPPAEATFIANASNSIVLTSVGANTPVSWSLGSAPSWLSLTDNGDGTATLSGTPPKGAVGTSAAEIAPLALGSSPDLNPVFTSYPVTVVNTPTLLSPRTATFAVGSQGSFPISASEGDIHIYGDLPQGLSFNVGNPATIEGTPTAGSGGQYHVNVGISVGARALIYGSLTLNVNEAPSIISRSSGIIPAGLPGSFTVSTTGFPSVSAMPLAQPVTPPTSPDQGKGMFFTVTGLPPTLRASNLNPDGFATGSLSIEGSPLPDDVGSHFVQITAQNGVGEIARQSLTLQVVPVGGIPASGTACSGAFNGVFRGDIEVSQGQNCSFVGGAIVGHVRVIGGYFALSNTVVHGNVEIQGFSQFSINHNSTIVGGLTIKQVTGEAPSELCASTVGYLLVEENAIPIDIGSEDGTCQGNLVTGQLHIFSNWAPIELYRNHIVGPLLCANGPLLSGGGNMAQTKTGSCFSF